MKRHLELRRFSDDHHQGLVNARRLKRARPVKRPSSRTLPGIFSRFGERTPGFTFVFTNFRPIRNEYTGQFWRPLRP